MSLLTSMLDSATTATRRVVVGTGHYLAAAGVPSTRGVGANTLYVQPVSVDVETTFDRIGIDVTTAGAASTVIRLGIYDTGADGMPDSLVLSAGSVAGDSTGVKEITISQSLSPGVYWLGAVAQGGTPTVRCITSGLAEISPQGSSSANPQGVNGYVDTTVSGALPSTWTAAGAGIVQNSPTVFLRGA